MAANRVALVGGWLRQPLAAELNHHSAGSIVDGAFADRIQTASVDTRCPADAPLARSYARMRRACVHAVARMQLGVLRARAHAFHGIRCPTACQP